MFLSMIWFTLLMSTTWRPLYVLVVVLLTTLNVIEKSNLSTEDWQNSPDLVKTSVASQVTINLTVLSMRSVPLTSFQTLVYSGLWIQQLPGNSTALQLRIQWPFSIFKAQLTNLKQNHNRYPFHYDRMIVKRKKVRVCFTFCKEITYRTDDLTKQLLRLQNWVICGKTEQKMEIISFW